MAIPTVCPNSQRTPKPIPADQLKKKKDAIAPIWKTAIQKPKTQLNLPEGFCRNCSVVGVLSGTGAPDTCGADASSVITGMVQWFSITEDTSGRSFAL